MTDSNEEKPISICYTSISPSDKATLERVISFSKARGSHFEVILDPSDADVLITDDNEDNVNKALQLQSNNVVLVISDDKECTKGDVQLQRPLLVTKVMGTMASLSSKVLTAKSAVIAEEPKAVQPPAQAQDTPKVEVAAETKDAEAPSTEARFTALVIDDSAAIRKQLEIELRTSNIRCNFAESGEQALEKIADTYYDLIFLDIMMPGIDGYETCGEIRKDPRYKKTPIIMLSGKISPLDEVKGVVAGASTYLTKPINHTEFQNTTSRITRWLEEFSQ